MHFVTTLLSLEMPDTKAEDEVDFLSNTQESSVSEEQYKITAVLLTLFPVFILYLQLIYFIAESLYLSIPFGYFTHPPQLPLPPWQSPVCSQYLCLFLFCLFVCFSDSTYKWDHTVFVFV